MFSLLLSIKELFQSFKFIFKSKDTRALFALIIATLGIGTLFYTSVEKMSPLDAVYLSFITLTTIGYGDLHPITAIGKIFTMCYATVGLGFMAMFISVIAKSFVFSAHNRKHKNTKE